MNPIEKLRIGEQARLVTAHNRIEAKLARLELQSFDIVFLDPALGQVWDWCHTDPDMFGTTQAACFTAGREFIRTTLETAKAAIEAKLDALGRSEGAPITEPIFPQSWSIPPRPAEDKGTSEIETTAFHPGQVETQFDASSQLGDTHQ